MTSFTRFCTLTFSYITIYFVSGFISNELKNFQGFVFLIVFFLLSFYIYDLHFDKTSNREQKETFYVFAFLSALTSLGNFISTNVGNEKIF